MSPSDDAKNAIESAMECLRKSAADWGDARIEDVHHRKFSTGSVGGLSTSTSRESGVGIRQFANRVSGFAAATGFDDCRVLSDRALSLARLCSSREKAEWILPTTELKDVAIPVLENRTTLDIGNLLGEYSERCQAVDGVRHVQVTLDSAEGWRSVVTPLGSALRPVSECALRGLVRAERADKHQRLPLFVSAPASSYLPERLEQSLKRIQAAVELVQEQECSRYEGKFDLVLSPRASALLIHEAFAHLTEADRFPHSQALPLGRHVSPINLNISDVNAPVNYCGSHGFDDEGAKAASVPLVTDGRWVGLLTDIETSSRLNLSLTGSARSTSYRYPPVPRVRTTSVASGKHGEDEMIAGIDSGLYVDWPAGGHIRGNVVAADYMVVRSIQHGRLGRLTAPMRLASPPLALLAQIRAVGNNVEFFDDVGWCSRGVQRELPITMGAPSLMIAAVPVHSI